MKEKLSSIQLNKNKKLRKIKKYIKFEKQTLLMTGGSTVKGEGLDDLQLC